MKISVAMCTYNGAQYLHQQLRSIVKQTRLVDEIVICDDGSKDKTIEIIKKIAILYPQIKVKFVRNSVNKGYTKNFEQAMILCSGDIIFLSDQDDIWMPNKVETFCKYFERNPEKEFVFSNAELINHINYNCYRQTLFDVVGLDIANKDLFNKGHTLELLSTSGRVTGSTSAVKASFLPYCIPFLPISVRPIHDEIMAIAGASYNKIGFIDECLIKYRQHRNQSVGIKMLFKFPPKHWELAECLRTCNIEMVDITNKKALQRIRFIQKRFWILRSKFSLVKILHLFFLGEYKANYDNPYFVFIWDFKGIFIRLIDKIKLLRIKK